MGRRSAGTQEPAHRAHRSPQRARTTPRSRTHRCGVNSDSGGRRGLGARELRRKEPQPRPRPAPHPTRAKKEGRREEGRARLVLGGLGFKARAIPALGFPPHRVRRDIHVGYRPGHPHRAHGLASHHSQLGRTATFSHFTKENIRAARERARPSHQAGGGAGPLGLRSCCGS